MQLRVISSQRWIPKWLSTGEADAFVLTWIAWLHDHSLCSSQWRCVAIYTTFFAIMIKLLMYTATLRNLATSSKIMEFIT